MNRLALAVASIGLLGAALAPNARADEWNKKTILTVNEPLQVPNKVLPPGKYVMKLMDSPSNRHIVQIFDGDEQHLQTTVLAIPNYRLRPTGKTQFGFWETPPGQPKALRAWFYPGDNFGQEFAYPKSQSVVIAASAKAIVPTTYAENETDLATARVGTVNETGQEAPMQETTAVAETTTPAPAPEAERAAPAPEPAPAPAPQELPKTASPLMMIALAGLLSLGAFSMLRLARS
jgi:cell division septation protein DedD